MDRLQELYSEMDQARQVVCVGWQSGMILLSFEVGL